MPIVHRLVAFLLLLFLAAPSARATEMTAKFSRVGSSAGTLEKVQVDLDWPQGASQGRLRIHAASLDFPSMSYRARNVDWQCPLQRDGALGWRCAGQARVEGSAAMPLVLAISPAMVEAELRVGQARLGFAAPSASPDLKRIKLERIPVAWMKAFLAGLWQEGNWTQGEITGRVDLITPSRDRMQADADLKLAGIGLETPSGWLAAAGLQARLQLDYREQAGRQSLGVDLDFSGGEFLAHSFYAVLPNTPVQLKVRAERMAAGIWTLPLIAWRDGSVLTATGKASFDASSSLSDLDMNVAIGELGSARDRYFSGLLAPAGFSDLMMTGAVRGSVHFRAGALSGFEVGLDKVNAIDSKARFTFAGMDGTLRWTRDVSTLESALSWDSGALYGIGLGAARFPFASRAGELYLATPASMPVLGGKLSLDQFRWQPSSGEQGARFELGMTMDALDMASLSQRLGWPPFTGTLAGRIPTARYRDNVLAFDGELEMSVFGGRIGLAKLVMERPFGIAPTLSADVSINDIGLEAMTSAFDFGSITGRMDGYIRNLRLVDWAPAAFDAKFFTDPKWPGKRRISQRAVSDISDVAGSGMLAGLQAKVLKVFDDFGYADIGLGCELKENVCRMDGIGSAGDGYIIVAGAGLPRIQVVGFRRQVDWPTLVSRLKAVTEGQAPVIQ